MATLTHHNSSINDLGLLLDYIPWPINDKFKYFLKSLKTFFLCTRKLGVFHTGGSLRSLRVQIDEVLSQNSRRIENDFRGGHHVAVLTDAVPCFETDIKSFEKEINGWYSALSDSLQLQQSCFPTMKDVTEIIDSVLENLESFHSLNFIRTVQATEALEEHLLLFRNFISFVLMLSVEKQHLDNFVIHAAVVAVGAARVTARLSYACFSWNPEGWMQIESEISGLQQKMKPVEPRVFENYKTFLTESQFCLNLDLDRDLLLRVMEDFISFLFWSLRKALQMDAFCQSSNQEDLLRAVWESLRLLRAILKKQPNKFDQDIRDLWTKVVCDAGVIIFSLYQKDAQIDTVAAEFLENFELIREECQGPVPETSASKFSRSVLDFFVLVEEKVLKVESSKVDADGLRRLRRLTDGLRSVFDVLDELQNQQEEKFKALWDAAAEVASKIEFLVDHLEYIPASLQSMEEEIMDLKDDASKISNNWKVKREVEVVTSSSTQLGTSGEFLDLEVEVEAVLHRLTRGSKQMRVVAIVGMAGLGKTTLAAKVYAHSRVMVHFHVCAWCCVSQILDKKSLLLELLNQTHPGNYLEENEDELMAKARRSLKGKRYLIVLDDVWTPEVWNALCIIFPDDTTGSRILLTSRYSDIVPQGILDENHFYLRLLTNEESWKLLQKKLDTKHSDIPLHLHAIGKKIAESCKGLPLTVVLAAGLLSTVEPDPDAWNEVLKSLSSGDISSETQLNNAWEVSYDYLPRVLKPCFLYFGLFPKDKEVSVKRLIWLWMAEGFVPLADVAKDYIMDLEQRNLVTVSEKGIMGGAKTYRMIDLLHAFCIAKSKEERFFQLLNGNDEILAFDEHCYLKRLCVNSRRREFRNLRLFHPTDTQSVLFFSNDEPCQKLVQDISFVIKVFKRLRVLDIVQIDLGDVLPSEMELLVRLRYLAVKGCLHDIPSSVGNLSNLETLVVDSYSVVTLPPTIWNLYRLRHLCIPNGFHFPIEDLDNFSGLFELESCSTAIISSWDICERLMGMFLKIRRLKCRVFKSWDTKNCNRILMPSSLDSLKSLHLSLFGEGLFFVKHKVLEHAQFEFCFPPTLMKLTVDHFELSRTEISALGALPNLECLKLLNVAFCGGIFHMLRGEFSNLKFLKLSDSPVVGWTATHDDLVFPPLQKLILKSCKGLQEIPSCLGTIETLRLIEVMDCSKYVERILRSIKEVQQDCGNLDLKILISH